MYFKSDEIDPHNLNLVGILTEITRRSIIKSNGLRIHRPKTDFSMRKVPGP